MAYKNVTVSISPELYRATRIWAAEHNTKITHVVRDFLRALPRLTKLDEQDRAQKRQL